MAIKIPTTMAPIMMKWQSSNLIQIIMNKHTIDRPLYEWRCFSREFLSLPTLSDERNVLRVLHTWIQSHQLHTPYDEMPLVRQEKNDQTDNIYISIFPWTACHIARNNIPGIQKVQFVNFVLHIHKYIYINYQRHYTTAIVNTIYPNAGLMAILRRIHFLKQ